MEAPCAEARPRRPLDLSGKARACPPPKAGIAWWIEDSPRLTNRARTAIAAAGEPCYLSVASWWEMAIKISLGKLRLPAPLDRFLAEHMGANAFHALPLRLPHAARLSALPFHHHDPFDRLLAAQALEERLSLVSADRIFKSYGVRRVW